jgi:streptogramin lyase
MPTQNEALLEAYAACPPSARIYYTLEIWQSSFDEPARVVANVGDDMFFGIEPGAPHRLKHDGYSRIFAAGPGRPRLAIGPDDAIWYSDFARGYLGRLDPATGEVKEWLSPSGPKSQPYGIVFTKDAVWYGESAAKPNTIVRFDPKTEKFQSWAIPGGGDIVRNMDVDRDGNPAIAVLAEQSRRPS